MVATQKVQAASMCLAADRESENQSTTGLQLPAIGRQILPVEAFIKDRFLITYRSPAQRLKRLLPDGLEIDCKDGYGFLSVCAIDLRNMGIAHTPPWLRFDNLEFLYRIGVRFRGEPAFWTLGSHVSSTAMAYLARRFSHYRPELARFSYVRSEKTFHLRAESSASEVATFRANLEGAEAGSPAETVGCIGARRRHDSCFGSVEEAASFLVGMPLSVGDRPDGRFQVQRIAHTPWQPHFVADVSAHFSFVESLCRTYDLLLQYDSTLHMQNIHQRWRRATCLTSR